MKKDRDNEEKRFNLYLSENQAAELRRLLDVGLMVSAVARQAIRKCFEEPLLPDSGGPFPKRLNFRLEPDDADLLARIADRENCPKAQAMRRLLDTYLTVNADAIDRLF